MIVSVIIPVYNVSEYIEECLVSVTQQTYTSIEALVVDDCGTDDSMAKVEKFVKAYHGPIDFRILHHTCNRGLSAARNTGMDAAKGEYIYFLDSDDYIYQECIKILVETITQEDGIDCAFGNFDRNNPFPPHIKVNSGVYSNGMSLFSNRDIYVMAWNHLYRTSFLRSHSLRFLEGIIHEDILWSFSVYCHIGKIAITDKITYFYRDRSCSICYKELSERYNDICKICKSIVEYVFECNLEEEKKIFLFANRELKRYYLLPIYSKQPELAIAFYNTLRQMTYWSFGQIWSLSHDKRRMLLHVHRILPKRIGFRYFQYVFAKKFDK